MSSPGPLRKPPAVVLVRPQEEGNVGAAARAMANMGLEELVLVEPAPALGTVARAFAVGAGHVLDGVRRAVDLDAALAPFQRVVGATSGRGRRLGAVVSPRELPVRLAGDPPRTTTAFLFGPEASGLTNDELARCGLWVRIPTAARQPTLNLAQAVLLLAYEWHLAALPAPTAAEAAPARAPEGDVEGLFRHVEAALRAVGFARDDTFRGVLRDLRRLAARSGLTGREVELLHGICRRVEGHVASAARRGSPPRRDASG